MKTTEELNKIMKTFPCTVTFTFGSFVNTLTVTSPKTGRTIAVKEGQFSSSAEMLEVVGIVVKALPQGGKTWVGLTIPQFQAVLDAKEAERDSYKESLSRSDDGDKCIASEETDGECPHCEEKILNRQHTPVCH